MRAAAADAAGGDAAGRGRREWPKEEVWTGPVAQTRPFLHSNPAGASLQSLRAESVRWQSPWCTIPRRGEIFGGRVVGGEVCVAKFGIIRDH